VSGDASLNGRLFVGGNVGIGTASPTSALHMVNTTTTNTNPLLAIQGYNVGASGSGDVTRQAMINMSRLATSGVQNSVSSQINLGSHSTAMINYSTIDFKLGGLPAAGNNYGSTPDVNVMTLTGQGYVGVGTTVPSYPLEIQGPGTIAGVSAYPYVGQLTLRAASTQKLVIGTYWTSGVGLGSYLQSSDQYSGAEHPNNISLNPNGGNVGIGTTNPSYTLHVNSPNHAAAYFYSTGNGNQILLQSSVGKTNSSGYWGMGHNSDDGAFYIIYQNSYRGAYLTYNGTGSFTGYSDRRLKEKIIDISGADMLSKLRLVKPVYFNFKNENDTHMGVIAQDIQSIFPDIVSVSSITIDDVVNPLGVCPTGLIYPLISALQEVDGQYQITKQEVVDLKSRLSSLEARLTAAGF